MADETKDEFLDKIVARWRALPFAKRQQALTMCDEVLRRHGIALLPAAEMRRLTRRHVHGRWLVDEEDPHAS